MPARTLRGTDPKAAKPSRPKILIFGRPGVGKTWSSIDFPSVYYIDTEGGANRDHYTDKLKKAGGAYFGPEHGSLDFDTVIEEVTSLATVKHAYRTLVIDSFSKLYANKAFEAAEVVGDDFGKDRKEANKPTRKLIRWLNKLDMNCILICHEKEKWSNKEVVGQTFDGWDKLEYELDLTLRIVKTGNSRTAFVAKSRLQEFPDGANFPWSYTEFAKKYGRDVIEAVHVPIIPASDAQVKELRDLVALLKVGDEVTQKWKEKAGVEDFTEMDGETIVKCIAHLRSKLPGAQSEAA
jgi:hypothetical protein